MTCAECMMEIKGGWWWLSRGTGAQLEGPFCTERHAEHYRSRMSLWDYVPRKGYKPGERQAQPFPPEHILTRHLPVEDVQVAVSPEAVADVVGGGVKADGGKNPMHLIPGNALCLVAMDPVIKALGLWAGGGTPDLLMQAWHALAKDPATEGELLWEVGKVLEHGATKYGAHNWRKGMKWSRLIGAAYRHRIAQLRGEEHDPESELPHRAHLGCCLLFLAEYQLAGFGEDDRTVWRTGIDQTQS